MEEKERLRLEIDSWNSEDSRPLNFIRSYLSEIFIPSINPSLFDWRIEQELKRIKRQIESELSNNSDKLILDDDGNLIL